MLFQTSFLVFTKNVLDALKTSIKQLPIFILTISVTIQCRIGMCFVPIIYITKNEFPAVCIFAYYLIMQKQLL